MNKWHENIAFLGNVEIFLLDLKSASKISLGANFQAFKINISQKIASFIWQSGCELKGMKTLHCYGILYFFTGFELSIQKLACVQIFKLLSSMGKDYHIWACPLYCVKKGKKNSIMAARSL